MRYINMANIIVKETKNIEDIKKVLCHKSIYNRIGGESLPIEDFTPSLDVQYIAGYIDSEIIGLMIYNFDKKRLKCHYQVLPEYRRRYSKELARMALGRAKNASIYAEIPECYPDVIRFAKDFNFKVVGSKPAEKIRSGELYDVVILRRDNEYN